eukprot:4540796-Pleurochrysis_carterae.AAC.3
MGFARPEADASSDANKEGMPSSRTLWHGGCKERGPVAAREALDGQTNARQKRHTYPLVPSFSLHTLAHPHKRHSQPSRPYL